LEEKNMLLILQLSKKMILSASLIFLTTHAFIPIVYAQKAVILNFDDEWIGQYNYVLPILQKYGFNATFYITCGCLTYQNSKFCNNAGGDSAMSWQNVAELAKLGYDIQSHGMSHKDLTKLSIKDLEYEVGQSKQCLLERNINSTPFGNPFASGWDNSTVVQTLSKYYDMARAGCGLLTFLEW
jgi:peptidoglycan/xylan/chitin deacetylase (PgdA/CDA1 family)